MGRAVASGRKVELLLALDIGERLFSLVLFSHLCFRFFDEIVRNQSAIHGLILMLELSVVFFVVFRKPAKDVSQKPQDWCVAALGTCMPLLVAPSAPNPIVPEFLCLCLILFGIAVQGTAKLVLNRSFGLVPANRGVKTWGPYAFVRHPIYAGYTITHVGFVLFAPNLWNALVYAAAFGFQLNRLYREERLLAADPAYQVFMQAVPYRLVPGVF